MAIVGIPASTLASSSGFLGRSSRRPDRSFLADRLWAGNSVMKTPFQVIGVVGDVRHASPLRKAEPEAYLSFSRVGPRPLIMVVRPRDRASALGEQLRQAAHGIGTRVIVDRIRRGTEWFDDRIVTPRRRTVLLGLLGVLGFVLALVGVF